MANPQKEDGNTGINNEVLMHLIGAGLNGTELAICLYVLRKTWGYSKTKDEISLSQFMDAIPATKPSICKALSNLQLVKIILLVKKGKSKISSNEWKFNKDFDTWQLVKKTKLVKKKKLTSKENFTNNIKVQKKEKDTNVSKKNKNLNYSILGLDDELLEEFKKHRQKKGAVETDRTLKMLNNQLIELEKNGIDRKQAIQEMLYRGWRALKAEWILKDQNKPGGAISDENRRRQRYDAEYARIANSFQVAMQYAANR